MNVKKIIIIILLTLVVLIVIGLGYGGNYLYNLALNPTTPKDMIFDSTDDEADTVEKDETSGITSLSSKDWLLDKNNHEDFYITSKDGLNLHNYLVKNTVPSKKWIIVVHGYTSDGLATADYARKFYDMGYNVIIPDLRAHGSSQGDYIGMGWDERNDIIDLINYIVNVDKESQIALFGVSMGAATVMNVSGEELPGNVKAIIEDCGYSSVWAQFSHQLKDMYNLPPFPMMHVANLIGRVRAGYWISEASPIDQLAKSKTPTLFIHGDQDDFVPFYMLDEVYNATSVPKEKLVIKGAGHAKSHNVNPKLYWETVYDFLNKYVQ